MKVLFVASECVPFAKAGGLGDVVGALPKALAARGVDARVLIPRYGFVPTFGLARHMKPLGVPLDGGESWSAVVETTLPGSSVPVYLLEHDALFGGPHIYETHGLRAFARYALLSRAALALPAHLGWTPDIFHVHDWPSAPVATLLAADRGRFPKARSVMSIHNLAHQPWFPKQALSLLGLDERSFHAGHLEDHGHLNPMKGGIVDADLLSTVSPCYAREIQSWPGGAGLEGFLSARAPDLVGIVNGIDDTTWDPATDPHLAAHFSASDRSGKLACKAALQRALGLAVRPEVPLIGIVGRFVHQKGLDLVADGLERILDLDAQMVMLGSGEPALEARFLARSHRDDGRFSAWIGFNEPLAHQIEAAADLFLMPSRFEPCGLNQLYSQRYGALPIVRATGGLDDTVENCDVATGAGTGFKFHDPTVDAVVNTTAWAIEVYRHHRTVFTAMQERAMKKSLGWSSAAGRYVELYARALGGEGSDG